MKNLLGWALFLFVVAMAWKNGKPWLDARMGSGSGGDAASVEGPAGECLAAAWQARESFGSGMSSLGSPGAEVDLSFRAGLDSAIQSAQSACTCGERACDVATEAMDLLEKASRTVDDPARVAEAAMNAARTLQRVDELLDSAG